MSYSTVNSTAGGETIKVLVPAGWANGGKCVIYHHGRTELASHLTSDTDKAGVVNRLTDDGYIVAASDAAGDNWGNQASLDAYAALKTYLDSNYAPSAYGYWAQSMGGLSALNCIANGVVVAGFYGAFPCCSLANMFNGNVGATYPPSIRTAYGIASDGSDYSSKTSGFDPSLRTASLYLRVPMRFVASASDVSVTKADNSDAMSAHVAAQLAEHDVITHTGVHGDASVHKPQDISDFFARCFVARSSPQRRM
jgi:hypothetical protein